MTLEKAGYDPTDASSVERGMAAFMAAQTIALAAQEEGERQGDGEAQEEVLAGVIPEMIPLLDLPSMREDAAGLRTLFQEDPELRQVRFDEDRALAWLQAVAHERPEQEGEEALAWLDRVAAEFAADGDSRQVVESLRDHLLSAAPRWAGRPAELRYLASGLLFATMATNDRGPNPLTTLLFRLTVEEAVEEGEARDRLLDAVGVDLAQLREVDPAEYDGFHRDVVDALLQMPTKDQEKILRLGGKEITRLRQAIFAEDFPVPLPVPCVLDPLLAMLSMLRPAVSQELDDEERKALLKQVSDLLVESAQAELHKEDRRLFAEVCEDWLESEASGFPRERPLVETLRHLARSDAFVAVEDMLILATLKQFRFSTVPGAPEIHLGSLELDGGELERYGEFLEKKGYPVLALRTYRASEALCSPSEKLRAKIAALTEEIADDGGPGGASRG